MGRARLHHTMEEVQVLTRINRRQAVARVPDDAIQHDGLLVVLVVQRHVDCAKPEVPRPGRRLAADLTLHQTRLGVSCPDVRACQLQVPRRRTPHRPLSGLIMGIAWQAGAQAGAHSRRASERLRRVTIQQYGTEAVLGVQSHARRKIGVP